VLNEVRKADEPLVERLFRIHDDFEFAIGQSANRPGIFRRQEDFHPLSIQSERIGYIKNLADVLKRDYL